jgi:hypothetical protein
LPRPTGVDEAEFYACLSCFADVIDLDAWSDAEFAADFEARIIAPGRHAQDLLERHRYLTRMYMTMSPHEMTEDPLFHANADLPGVPNVVRATRVTPCDGPDYIELDDGRQMALDPSGMLPDDMPPAAFIEEVPPRGAPITITDTSEDIDDVLARWNAEVGLDDGDGCACGISNRRFVGLLGSVLLFAIGWRATRRPR